MKNIYKIEHVILMWTFPNDIAIDRIVMAISIVSAINGLHFQVPRVPTFVAKANCRLYYDRQTMFLFNNIRSCGSVCRLYVETAAIFSTGWRSNRIKKNRM